MVNETALKRFHLSPEEALTTRIRWDERELDIVGVVKDYHHTSLHTPIDPINFYPQNNRAYLTLRIGTDQLSDKINTIQKVYQQHFYDNPFDYFFADAHFQEAYESESRYSQLFTAASLWAIFIACLGLYGLVTFAVSSKVKEIGVRKVMGATTWSVVVLLTRDFMKLVLIAMLIAAPIGWYFMRYWLSDFAYRIDIQWWMFVLAALGISLVAVLTIGFQSAKAALANPVKSLRSE
jgi:putative ABC transport system permease protein